MLRFLVVTAVTICSALQIFNYGVVMTEQPLKDDELFEVRLDSKVSKWFGTLDIGATTVPPKAWTFLRQWMAFNEASRSHSVEIKY